MAKTVVEIEGRLSAKAEWYRQDFRFYAKAYQKMYRKRQNAKNIFEKIRLTKVLKSIKNQMDIAERKYNLLQPSVE